MADDRVDARRWYGPDDRRRYTAELEDRSYYQWWSIQKMADLFHIPGRFVPFYGFEWTSADHGHQNVIYGDAKRGAPIFSAFADGSTDPAGLWAGLEKHPDYPAITIPHHPGLAMVHNDWDYCDPRYSSLVEIFQACRGNYEGPGAFRQYSDAIVDGTFTIDGLMRGRKCCDETTIWDGTLSVTGGAIRPTPFVCPEITEVSTVLRMINRLNDPSAGQLLIDGEDIVEVSDARLREIRNTKIGMVFQHFSLFPHRSVRDNAAYGLKVRGIAKTERYERADAALDRVGLGGRGDEFPHELSGGMRQRVGLARALAVDPPILLMDEPFSALDR